MIKEPEKSFDELIESIKSNADFSVGDKSDRLFIKSLLSFPKAKVPKPNFDEMRARILKRIDVKNEAQVFSFQSFFGSIPKVMRVAGGVVGSFLIVASLAVGGAVAALQSLPGQPLYPFKQAVENVQLKLADSESEKASLQIKFANNRLEELEMVLEKNRQGKASNTAVTKAVEQTVTNLAQTTKSVSEKTAAGDAAPQAQLLNKLVDLNSKQTNLLQTASFQSEGEIKIELEKALETSKISMEQAVENIERAGLKVEEKPIVIEEPVVTSDEVEARGKLTFVGNSSVNIGTAKFYLTKDTKFVNITQPELKVDQTVSIKGILVDGRTNALEIKLEGVAEKPQITE
jgi:hypothetical protein